MILRALVCLVLLSCTCLAKAENIWLGYKILKLNTEGLEIEKNVNEKGRFYFYARESQTKLLISIFISKEKFTDSRECRKIWWDKASKSPLKKENIKEYELSGYAMVEWDSPTPYGIQKNINAYLAAGDISVDVHISSIQNPNVKTMQEMLTRLNIVDTPEVYVLSAKGTISYKQKNYTDAVKSFRRVLELEAQTEELPRDVWRDVINHAGISEAMTGKMDNAARIFTDALKKDIDYPLFYYNLACVKAEQNNTAEALINLENALRNKDKIGNDRYMPNPMTDSSFGKIRKNSKFLELVRKYPVKNN